MGQSDSRLYFEDADFSIILEKENYIAGETIRGSVTLRLRAPYRSDKLELEFAGKEIAYFDPYDSNRESGMGEIKSMHIIIKTHILLYAFPDAIALPGVYTYPFSIDLPTDIPSSFLYCGMRRSLLRIRYRMKVGMLDLTNKYKPIY